MSTPSTTKLQPSTLSKKQIESLYEDGFLVLRQIVPRQVWSDAKRHLMLRIGAIFQAAAGYSPARPAALRPGNGVEEAVQAQKTVGAAPSTLKLFDSVRPLLEWAFDAPIASPAAGQMALNFPSVAGTGINETGWRDEDTPWFGWGGHIDGVWNGGIPIPQKATMSPADEALWYSDPSTNGGKRFYPAEDGHGEHACIKNFTCLVGIPLTDMSEEGSGNVGLMRGSHHDMESFFQAQTRAGGPLGPSGPGWPREYAQAPNRHGLCHYPPRVRAQVRTHGLFCRFVLEMWDILAYGLAYLV